MLILTAEGSSPEQNKSWEIEADRPMILGRGGDNDCSVPWDDLVSGKHAEVTVRGETLSVRCLHGARNVMSAQGKSLQQATIPVGGSFQIGQTQFAVTTQRQTRAIVNIVEDEAGACGHSTSLLMNPADIRMAVVSQQAASLWTAADEKQLAQRTLQILRQVLTGVDLLVMLSCDDVTSASRPQIVHWEKEESGVQAVVNRQLITKAIGQGATAIQVDSDAFGGAIRKGGWSFCVPVLSDAAVQWCIYVAGTFGESADYGPYLTPAKLQSDAAVTELVSHLIGAVRSVRSLENRFDGIRQFFSPRLLETVEQTDSGIEDLAPRETDIVAIYCDLRGFSRMVSKSSHDLHGLLRRISAALGIMTQSIIQHDGVIADFQGDSALGFWGWPIALADGPIPACRAALQIQKAFERAASDGDPELDALHVGIGIASGRAIAGRIGTRDQAKIGIFGPVANIAARLEGLTRKVGATILIDGETAAAAMAGLSPQEGRCRPLGSVQPAGFDHPVDVSELLPPESESLISNADIENFTDAVNAFRSGKWDMCRKLLGLLPADDRPRDFLLVQIASQNYRPPRNWSGIIDIKSK